MWDTDKESERWWIEQFAKRQMEKWPPSNPKPPGFRRRSILTWHDIGNKLADIQAEYDSSEELYPQHLVQRALMAIWPTLMPYRWRSVRSMSRQSVKRARLRVQPFLLALVMMAGKEGFASELFDFPRISIRKRKKSERRAEAVRGDTNRSRMLEEEVIGRAVVQEYRRHPHDRRSLDSAFLEVAALGSIEGIATNSARSVEGRYHAFRREAFGRGYADSRAIWYEMEGIPWPDDQIWLEDFPPLGR